MKLTEYYSTSEQSFLLIHKNACSTVKSNLSCRFGDTLQEVGPPIEGSLKWAVIRDPYDRFISALAYDISTQYPVEIWKDEKALYNVIELLDLKKYLTHHATNSFYRSGILSHSILQTIYLFDNNIDIVVEDKDLKHFIPIHFKHPVPNQNIGVSEYKECIRKIIDKIPSIKQKVLLLLEIDYVTLESFKDKGAQWTWGSGRLF